MTIQEINKAYSRIIGALDGKELRNAFAFLQGLIASTREYQFQDSLNKLQETYQYMLRYRTEGAKDPMQEQIYQHLLTSTYELADQVKHKTLFAESPLAYYNRRRSIAATPENMEYDEIHQKLIKASENSRLEFFYETGLKLLFHKIWVADSFLSHDKQAIKDILNDDNLPDSTGSLVVSALFLALQDSFDKEKMDLLFDAAQSPQDEIRVRALVCILLTLYTYRKRIHLYPQVKNRLEALAEGNPGFSAAIQTITLRFILARETEKITRKLQEEIIPEMMKLTPKIGRKINLKDFSAEQMGDDMNPEWEMIISEHSELGKKMQEFGELQQEGADVMHSTFVHLKNFPFFRELSNWFLPFITNHTALAMPGEDKGVNIILDTLSIATFMCSSDKYSLYFSMLQLPDAQRQMMLGQFDSQATGMVEQAKEELMTRKGKIETIAGQYIQDLYRFYKLHPSRRDFDDIFTWALDFHNLPILQPYISDPESLRTIAEYYLRKGYYADALVLFSRLSEEDQESDILFQKMGYCRQMQGEIDLALQAYLRADLLNPDSKWVIRRIGACYRSLKQPAQALPYYQRCEALLPDDLTIQMSIGHCLLEMKEYDEALKYYFKVDYLDHKSNKAWRPIAWCSFLTGRYDQARKYYKKITEAHPVTQDYLNAGHTEWALQHIKGALGFYQQAVEMESGDYQKFLEQFNQDIPDLLTAGIEENEIPLMLDQLQYQLGE
ncbi:tetratricopeptide repeat protein [Parabacteroides sp. PF5-6]|uniref:tetratricopeptide repeat protein n=1 Tax=Parabacteroides sp. PF5-6 TaxID=1742403 RepID=UPI0024071DB1|nr:tetratricopeptide repeat protein [Parabacteroides sp. PF5-6]MDF9829508.1 tetratricopeptide (TPR) repeat protein [Parabacteroides sp. PF5-6]